jgi:hypothetical protein
MQRIVACISRTFCAERTPRPTPFFGVRPFGVITLMIIKAVSRIRLAGSSCRNFVKHSTSVPYRIK